MQSSKPILRSSRKLRTARVGTRTPGKTHNHTVRGMTIQKIASGTVHRLPADFRRAIESNATAKSVWADITPLARNEWICWVTSAKKEDTRKRRIEVGIDKMRGGMRRPCCWPGCPHR